MATFSVSNLLDAGPGSLRDAIALANQTPGADRVEFDASLDGAALELSTDALTITDSVIVDASRLSSGIVIDASAADPTPKVVDGKGIQFFIIDDGDHSQNHDVELVGLTFTGSDGDDSAIHTRENLSVRDSTFVDVSSRFGAAVGGRVEDGHFVVEGTVFRDSASGAIEMFLDSSLGRLDGIEVTSINTTSISQGHVVSIGSSNGSTIDIENSRFTDNHARFGGAAWFNPSGSQLTIQDSIFTGNTASRLGGAIGIRSSHASVVSVESTYLAHNRVLGDYEGTGGGLDLRAEDNSKITITHSTVTNNSAASRGGGIHAIAADEARIDIVEVLTTDNMSGRRGGGIDASTSGESAVVNINGATISSNTSYEGGGIRASGNVAVDNSLISANHASVNGGGLLATSFTPNVFRMEDSVVTNNTSDSDGGGVFASGPLHASRVTIHGNSAGNDGGGLLLHGNPDSALRVEHSDILDNTAYRNGGGASFETFRVEFFRSTVAGNTALTGIGGGVASRDGGQITESTVESNSAAAGGGGIYFSGSATIELSRVFGNTTAGNGGGIHSRAEKRGELVEIAGSSINGNTAAGIGGGVYLYVDDDTAAIEFTNSTVASNRGDDGGGLALRAEHGEIAVANSTVSGNLADEFAGGLIADANAEGMISIDHSTIAFNSAATNQQGIGAAGGVFVSRGTTSISNSIIAENVDVSEAAPDMSRVISAGFELHASLVGNGTGSGLTAAPVDAPDPEGNFIGGPSVFEKIDPQLVPLTMLGGPTPVHALLPTSPALNSADPLRSTVTTDQRFMPFARDEGSGPDMGAYELQSFAPSTYVVDLAHDEFDLDYSEGDLSLREAIGLANGSRGTSEVINFHPLLVNHTIEVASELVVNDPLVISGLGKEQLAIDASAGDPTPEQHLGDGIRVFAIDDFDESTNLEVVIQSLTLQGGDVDEGGGAVLSAEALTLSDVRVVGNAAGFGGGLYAEGSLTMLASHFEENMSSFEGGGVYLAYLPGGVLLQDSVFENNQSLNGGGLFARGSFGVERGAITISRSSFLNNTASRNGGGLELGRGLFFKSVLIESSTIANNTSQGVGGGIKAFFGLSAEESFEILNSTISGNEGQLLGGVFVEPRGGQGTWRIAHSTIVNNRSTENGVGGLQAKQSFQVEHSIIAANYDASLQIPDVLLDPQGSIAFSLVSDNTGSNLIEAPVGQPDANGNLIGNPQGGGVIAAQLGPLTENGGPTLTHALFANSPALNAGDPAVLDPPEFDQRGAPFARVALGRLDMGALELQSVPLTGDFNFDGVFDCQDVDALVAQIVDGNHNPSFDLTGDEVVDRLDLDAWLIEAGSAQLPLGRPYPVGDATLDGIVDGQDFIAWNINKFTATPAWCAGDFDANGLVDGQDFIAWNVNKFQSQTRPLDGEPLRRSITRKFTRATPQQPASTMTDTAHQQTSTHQLTFEQTAEHGRLPTRLVDAFHADASSSVSTMGTDLAHKSGEIVPDDEMTPGFRTRLLG